VSFIVIGKEIHYLGQPVATIHEGLSATLEDCMIARLKGLPCVEAARRNLEAAQQAFEDKKRKHFHGAGKNK